jgi:hypothetical protein
MINLFNARIESLFIHRVGNKSRNEPTFFSDQSQAINDETHTLLKEYFLKPFREKEESYYHFDHEVDLTFNEMFTLSKELFLNPNELGHVSKKITNHLYDQSNHPHIKNGEVYVIYFTGLVIDNQKVDALGVSSFITDLSGTSTFPIVVSNSASLRETIEIVVHEWAFAN